MITDKKCSFIFLPKFSIFHVTHSDSLFSGVLFHSKFENSLYPNIPLLAFTYIINEPKSVKK